MMSLLMPSVVYAYSFRRTFNMRTCHTRVLQLQGGRSGNHVTRSSSGDLSEPGSRLSGRAGSTSGALPHPVVAQTLPQPLPHMTELQPVPQPIANGTAAPLVQKPAPTAAEGAPQDTASAAGRKGLNLESLKGLTKEKRNAKLGEQASSLQTGPNDVFTAQHSDRRRNELPQTMPSARS